MPRKINLNADVGEGFDDDALIGIATSVNLACGAHAGGETQMRRVLAAAAARGVGVGAHPGFADREGFGRRPVEIAPDALERLLHDQILLAQHLARECGIAIGHVKAHGALYNMAAERDDYADALSRATQRADAGLVLLSLPDCAMQRSAARHGLRYAAEAFADRGYRGGRLIPRGEAGDLIADPFAAAKAGLARAEEGCASLCVHGDKPGAVEIARAVRAALDRAGYRVLPLEAVTA